MPTNVASAIAAYANPMGRLTGTGSGGATAAPTQAGGASFGDVLAQATRDTVGAMRKGEDMSALATVGKADLTDVVQAVTNAEVTLQTVTTVRDRVVSAYQEILKMPI